MKPFLAWLSSLLIRAVTVTLRVTIIDRGGVLDQPDHPPVILAFWHNRLFLMAPFCERYCAGRISLALISRSRDGQFMADVAAKFGVKSARGSSSKHGLAAALAAIHAARDENLDIVITPDGPRGPRCQVQPGILRLAQTTGRPIVTLTAHVQWKKELNSWDRFQVPIPFSRCELITGESIHVPENASPEELTELGLRVAASLEALNPSP